MWKRILKYAGIALVILLIVFMIAKVQVERLSDPDLYDDTFMGTITTQVTVETIE